MKENICANDMPIRANANLRQFQATKSSDCIFCQLAKYTVILTEPNWQNNEMSWILFTVEMKRKEMPKIKEEVEKMVQY